MNMMSMLYSIFAFVLVFGILAVVVFFIYSLVKQGNKSKQLQYTSSLEIARDEEFRRLAESALLVQQELKAGQDRMLDELEQLRTRMTAMEKLLREVE